MVKIREDIPQLADGSVDVQSWARRVLANSIYDSDELLFNAIELAAKYTSGVTTGIGADAFRQGLETAEILFSLNIELEVLAAAILYFPVRYGKLSCEEISKEISEEVSFLIKGVLSLQFVNDSGIYGEDSDYTDRDNLRRMLLSVVKDPRVVIIKLAEHTVSLRSVSDSNVELRTSLARQAQNIFAPMANRLGIGQIKWELEDLSFRYLNSKEYKAIASSLDEKRLARETYIKEVVSQIKAAIASAGIQAEVIGRAKHIYSIWRKMVRKGISFDEVHDVRAIRVLVSSVSECYAALGVVHSLWQYVANEFDDYIAAPKANGYRSLHTAVIGPSGKVVEVQIRTYQMHKEAELGFASHWAYKEGRNKNPKYEKNLSSLKNIVDWNVEVEKITDPSDNIEAFKAEVFNDTVYVVSPLGKVIALPDGSTPLDFAYAIHTEVGHRCRGAKVDGKLRPLTYKLKSGQQVEIIKAKEGGPSRDWLNSHASYIHSSRARAKILHWFRQQSAEENIQLGKDILYKEFKSLGIEQVNISKLAANLKFQTSNELYLSLGIGEIRLSRVLSVLNEMYAPKEQSLKLNNRARKGNNDIVLNGIENMIYSLAKCCKPIPYENIKGYITVGKGISVHKSDCINIKNAKLNERIVDVNWNNNLIGGFVTDIQVLAHDRNNLLLDIGAVLVKEAVNISSFKTSKAKGSGTVMFTITLELDNLELLRRVFVLINQVPGVISSQRAT